MGKRGIALITTLMIMGLLLILLGAFMQLHRSQFALLGGSGDRENVLRTVFSVHEYCVNRIERDKRWGEDDFSADYDDPDLAGFMSVREVGGTNTIEGTIPSLDSTFTVSVTNELEDPAVEQAELVIKATSGRLTREVTSRLRPAPLFDGGMSAGGGLHVSTPEWTVASKDPYRNLLRARGDIRAPDYDNIKFEGRNNSDGNAGSDEGIFWSRQDVSFYKSGTDLSVTDPSVMRDAMTATGGRFIANSGVSQTIHDLQVDDLVAPSSSTSIQSGEYRFTEATATFQNWEQTGTDSFGNPEYGWVQRTRVIPILGRYSTTLTDYWFARDTLPGTIQNLDFGLSGTAHEEDTDTFFIDADDKVEVTLDLPSTQPAFNILASGDVDIPGEFKVTTTTELPALSFGGSDAQIRADGDVTFEGDITGTGTIISETGGVRLKVADIAVSGNQLGVSVFANNDIEVESTTGGGDLTFHGLLYARENIYVTGDAQNFIVDGAMVARNGDINITTNGKVDLTYNPDHLEVLLDTLPDNRTKLESLVWKE